MSLIPSESYSFPDHFTSTRAASRRATNAEPEPEEEFIEPAPEKPAIVALPNPKPQLAPAPKPRPVVAKENPAPMRKVAPPVPNPALRRASAPPPKVPETPPVRKIALPPNLKPKVRWNNRAPASNPSPAANNGESNGNGNGAEHLPYEPLLPPAQNVIQMKPAPPVPRPPREMPRLEKIPPPPPFPTRPSPVASRPSPAAFAPPQKPVPPARPVQPPVARETVRPNMPAKAATPPPPREAPRPVVAQNVQADFFEDFAQSGETALSKRRRKEKMRRFMVCETIAVGVLLPLAFLGLMHRPENAALVWIMNIFTIASAVAAALIPILFFAVTPTLPEIER
jgi:hypothetical protein